ncbi:DUF4301 family protein [Thermodesulfobacteriota bacterium]
MADPIFSEEDERQIKARGTTPDKILAQIELFKKGFPYTALIKPCTVNDGIDVIADSDIERLVARYSEAAFSGRFMKFVPASGAASRMFKLLISIKNDLESAEGTDTSTSVEKEGSDYKKFIQFEKEIRRFAFYGDLESVLSRDGLNVETLLAEQDYVTFLDYVLGPKGLNLSNSPKGLIPFHRYSDHTRTPIEEHLAEAKEYVKDCKGIARVHFTVSPEHEKIIKAYIDTILERYERAGVIYDLSFSTQKPSTDTIAVNPDNSPFREHSNKLLFRPAGHGALIVNLSEINGDIIFIKNIDNVVPDAHKADTYLYKKLLGGYLIEIQDAVFMYMDKLSSSEVSEILLEEMFDFIRTRLSVISPTGIEQESKINKIAYLISVLDRPLRVCGIVKNTGEPGGGPFWVRHGNRSISIQIVEEPQVDTGDEDQKKIYSSSTHFNPVDLVCAVRDYKGQQYNLNDYTDPDAGFISMKSKDGRDLKALELPGLWQGSMAKWNTVFVEVPITTFNPVKTVFDLLRDLHQS